MATRKPTIVISHGSYHTPAPYAGLRQLLEKQGFETHCPHLPTADPKYLVADPNNPSFEQPAPPAGEPQHTQDAEVLSKLLETLIEDEGKEVLLVAHSSGGWTATECSTPPLQRKQRSKEGKKGGVMGLFYMSSILVTPGQSPTSLFSKASELPAEAEEGKPSQWFTLVPNRSLTRINEPLYFFFHDIPKEEGEKWASGLTACPFLMSPLTNDAYSALPCAYMVCEGDRVLPQIFQELMIKSAEDISGKKMDVYKCAGGHESFLSYPNVYVDSILNFAEKCA